MFAFAQLNIAKNLGSKLRNNVTQTPFRSVTDHGAVELAGAYDESCLLQVHRQKKLEKVTLGICDVDHIEAAFTRLFDPLNASGPAQRLTPAVMPVYASALPFFLALRPLFP
jgi:hypothetical protein